MTQDTRPDPAYLTVKELAALLRLKERKVYDLAASGAVPCSRATGKLLFPKDEIQAWIDAATSGGAAPTAAAQPLPPIVLGSHDPLLDWALRQSRCGLASFFDGSMDGLRRFLNGEGVAAGLHIFDPKGAGWNRATVAEAAAGRNAVLISFATRRRGLVHRPGAPACSDLSGLAGRRIARRQPESGTDRLFRHLAAEIGLDTDALDVTEVARTEDDAVAMVQRGEADVTFGLEAVALGHGLSFAPLIEEEFALIVDRKAWFDPALQTFAAFCASAAFAGRAASLRGYDIRKFGQVAWNG